MASNFPPVNEIFDELDRLRDFCRYEGHVFNEQSLYNKKDPVWQAYERWKHYKNAEHRAKSRNRK